MGNKPYRDLAWGISTLSTPEVPIAVLRYEKSSHYCQTHSTDPACLALWNGTFEEEYMNDARSALTMLRQKFPKSHLFVLGHSLGGLVAPLIAYRNRDLLSGLVGLAAAAERIVQCAVRQDTYILEEGGTPLPPDKKQQIEEMRVIDGLLQSGKLPDDYPFPQLLRMYTKKYLRAFYAYDKLAAATNVAVSGLPMLFLNGARDYQVTVVDDFDVWRGNLTQTGDVGFKIYAGLTHDFYQAWPSDKPSYPSEYQTPGHVREDVIRDLIAFTSKSISQTK